MADSVQNKVVLIVEDDAALANAVCALLNSEPGYTAVSVPDGHQALAVIHGLQASVLLLDVALPDMTGWQVYDVLRADPATADLPIIFVTASPDRAEFAERGITHVLGKPFIFDDLLAEMAACGAALPQGSQPAAAEPSAPEDESGEIEYFLAVSG